MCVSFGTMNKKHHFLFILHYILLIYLNIIFFKMNFLVSIIYQYVKNFFFPSSEIYFDVNLFYVVLKSGSFSRNLLTWAERAKRNGAFSVTSVKSVSKKEFKKNISFKHFHSSQSFLFFRLLSRWRPFSFQYHFSPLSLCFCFCFFFHSFHIFLFISFALWVSIFSLALFSFLFQFLKYFFRLSLPLSLHFWDFSMFLFLLRLLLILSLYSHFFIFFIYCFFSLGFSFVCLFPFRPFLLVLIQQNSFFLELFPIIYLLSNLFSFFHIVFISSFIYLFEFFQCLSFPQGFFPPLFIFHSI